MKPKGHKETFRGAGYVCYLNFGDGFAGIHICSDSLNCMCYICAIFIHIKYPSIKVVFFKVSSSWYRWSQPFSAQQYAVGFD